MTDQIGASKPPAFYEDIVEHLRMIADYISAAGDRANATAPKDGSEMVDRVTYSHLEQAIAQHENNLDLTGYSIVRLDPDAAWDITGIVADPGRLLILFNVGSFTITLEDQDTLSTDINRMRLGAPLALVPDGTAILWYDPITERWRRLFPL
jgi:hypothetical protein